jgi:anti-sigma-K factor RskA
MPRAAGSGVVLLLSVHPEDPTMSEATPGWRSRLTEPSSAAGLAALLALLMPDLAREAPAIVELALTALAAIAAIVAIVRREGNGSNGQAG